MPREDRSSWDNDRVKQDYKMWREIIADRGKLTDEQMERYEATRKEVAKRKLIPVDGHG